MRFRSFIIAYALVLAILLFADRRPHPSQQDRYSHVVDLTDSRSSDAQDAAPTGPIQLGIAENEAATASTRQKATPPVDSRTRIIAPDALIPGTWTAGQIPPERLIAPLVVLDLNATHASAGPVTVSPATPQISLDDISAWETQHGAIPQGAIVAIRQAENRKRSSAAPAAPLPINADAIQFLMDARYTTGFVFETAADFTSDRTLARQIALHGNYVVEGTARLSALPASGSLIVVAPAKNKIAGKVPVRVLAMVR